MKIQPRDLVCFVVSSSGTPLFVDDVHRLMVFKPRRGFSIIGTITSNAGFLESSICSGDTQTVTKFYFQYKKDLEFSTTGTLFLVKTDKT